MAQPAKFLFDTEFVIDARGRARLADEDEERLTRAELDAACAEARAAGAAESAMREREASERRQAEALERMAEGLRGLAERQGAVLAEALAQATRLALAIARRVAPAALARQPLAEIEALVGHQLAELVDEPRVVVRVAADLVGPLEARLDGLAAASGFAGAVILIADDALAPGDCRIEWADGGVERDEMALWQAFETAIARVLDDQAQEPGATAPEARSQS